MNTRTAASMLAALLVSLASDRPANAAQASRLSAAPALRLSRLFADGMVLQRDQPIAIWGWAAPGAPVSVEFRTSTRRAAAATSGAWKITLPAASPGGPFTLRVRSNGETIELRDVLVGDVWVASGQSNMEFDVAHARNASTEIAAAHDPQLRQFKVPTSWANAPEADLAGGQWTQADSQHVGAFSAVGYFFARELRRTTKVPIGIINTTWGGSNIETWLSRQALGITPDQWSAVLRAQDAKIESVRAALREKIGGLPETDAGLVGNRALWADPLLDDAAWPVINVPAYWESQGYDGLDGVAWYRLAFDLSEREVSAGVSVSLAAVDDDDISWVNGVEVGRTNGYNVPRLYSVPASALRVGRNVLAVRVTDNGGGGGINGAASLVFGGGTMRPLAGTWKFRVGTVSFQPDGQQINKIPSVLYNRMLHPITPFAIKGVIWYQGESNANSVEQASAYRGQFETLIRSWRAEWGRSRDALPFLWVQLPNYGKPDAVPPLTSTWATQRESMQAALALPRTGQAIAIDVGEAANLHPPNKQDVGLRLARVARSVAYGEKLESSGPTYRSHLVRADTVVIEFNHAANGLETTAGDGQLRGFAIAGADRKFVWASARIVADRVHVWSGQVTNPVAVRYAWSNSPDNANLYSKDRLPAAPFRSDRW